jgi:hypothetical protein
MPTHQLTLWNIQHLENGKVAAAFAHAIAQCARDVEDRCGDKAKRTVTLTCELTPELDPGGSGALDTIDVKFRVKSAVPVRRSPGYKMLPHGPTGTLVFQEHSPFDPRQNEFQYAQQANAQNDQVGAVADNDDDDDDIGGDDEVEI